MYRRTPVRRPSLYRRTLFGDRRCTAEPCSATVAVPPNPCSATVAVPPNPVRRPSLYRRTPVRRPSMYRRTPFGDRRCTAEPRSATVAVPPNPVRRPSLYRRTPVRRPSLYRRTPVRRRSPNRVRRYIQFILVDSLDIRRRMRYLQPFLNLIRVVLWIDIFEYTLFSIHVIHASREPGELIDKNNSNGCQTQTAGKTGSE